MQQIKTISWVFQVLRKWPNRSGTSILLGQQNVRGIKWDSLEKRRLEFVKHMQKLLPLSYEQGTKMYNEVPALRSTNQMVSMKPKIDFLLTKNIELESIIENPFLLLMKREIFERKLGIIDEMCPRDVNHFLPLLELKLTDLKKIAKQAKAERMVVPKENRIYYFSTKLELNAHVVAEHFANNVSMFLSDFKGLQKKLHILQDYNVPSLNIIESLYAFRCSDERLISRLERIQSTKIKNIRLWAINCSDEQFEAWLCHIAETEKTEPPTVRATVSTEKSEVVGEIRDMLLCNDEEAAMIYYNHLSDSEQLESAETNISYLNRNQFDNRTIVDNPFLLTMDLDELKAKLHIIKEMQPRSVIDFAPLLVIDKDHLAKIRDQCEKKRKFIEQKHLVYYFSEKLQINPSTVSRALAKHKGIFPCEFKTLAKKMDILLSHNIAGPEILSGLKVFETSIEKITNRLKLLGSNKTAAISPWMLFCEKDRFNRMVEQRRKKNEILDNSKDVAEYLTKRLNWSEVQLEKFKDSFPGLFKHSVLKLNEQIEYLVNEAHYTVDDINGHIFIFRCNLLETKCRMNELESLGCRPKLAFVADDRKVYLKKVEKLCRKTENGLVKFQLIEKRVREQKASKMNE